MSTWESKVPLGSRYAPSICRGICREACSTLARGQAQPNAEATSLVWLSTLMGDCWGKSPCRKKFREDGTLSCPYAGFAGGGPAELLLLLFPFASKRSCLTGHLLALERCFLRLRHGFLHVPPRAASRFLTHSFTPSLTHLDTFRPHII